MIIFIDWEGRNYRDADLFADIGVVARAFDMNWTPGELYTFPYDTGMLISNTPAPDFTKVVCTRGGEVNEPEDWTKNEPNQPHQAREDKLAQDPANWQKFPSIIEMIKFWIEEKWLD